MEYVPNDHEDHSNQHENSLNRYNETGHHFVNMIEGQWKLRQQDDQKFPMQGKTLKKTNTSIRRKKEIQKKKYKRAGL